MPKTITWLPKDAILPTVFSNLRIVESVLDIGCGIRPQDYIIPSVHICCEPYKEYVDYLLSKTTNINDRFYVILQMTWEQAVECFPPGSVDTIFLIDVIEHLEKNLSKRLIAITEHIAREQIIIFTPLDFLYQNDEANDAWGYGGMEWQRHKSGWLPSDFDDTWDIFVCEAYHLHDNKGRFYEQPVGAFWAIRNVTTPAKVYDKKTFHQLQQTIEQFQQERRQFQTDISRLEQELNHMADLKLKLEQDVDSLKQYKASSFSDTLRKIFGYFHCL